MSALKIEMTDDVITKALGRMYGTGYCHALQTALFILEKMPAQEAKLRIESALATAEVKLEGLGGENG